MCPVSQFLLHQGRLRRPSGIYPPLTLLPLPQALGSPASPVSESRAWQTSCYNNSAAPPSGSAPASSPPPPTTHRAARRRLRKASPPLPSWGRSARRRAGRRTESCCREVLQPPGTADTRCRRRLSGQGRRNGTGTREEGFRRADHSR